jgi:hypothetical protein
MLGERFSAEQPHHVEIAKHYFDVQREYSSLCRTGADRDGALDSDPAGTYAYVVERLNAFGLAYIHIIEGATQGPREVPDGFNLQILRRSCEWLYRSWRVLPMSQIKAVGRALGADGESLLVGVRGRMMHPRYVDLGQFPRRGGWPPPLERFGGIGRRVGT